MPEYVVVINKDGLDTVIEVPKKPTYKTTFSEKTALKIAVVIYAFRHNRVYDPRESTIMSSGLLDIAKRIEKGLTIAGAQYAHASFAADMRTRYHSSSDYIRLRVKMSEKDMKAARAQDPYSAASEVMIHATSILHGTKEGFGKWMRRMEMEKELKEM